MTDRDNGDARVKEYLVNGDGETPNGNDESGEDDNSASEDSEGEREGYVLLSQANSDDEDDPNATPLNELVGSDSQQQQQEASLPTSNEINISDVDEVRRAMSGFTLPSSATPLWAQAVPEEVWKKELLDGLRNRPKDQTRPS